MLARWLLYGLFGWCAEIVWTAAYDFIAAVRAGRRPDVRLIGKTYLWMLPIYGAGGLAFERAHAALGTTPWIARGLVYMVGCFAIEYVAAMVLKAATGKIPWDYSYARWHVQGAIRLDYAPVWFAFGMILERIEPIVRAFARAL